ncbi:MAG: insulinase family protein [Deltaproteobacteria bacterium]|nr:insulinase family protein [Deltaproteobacteria bacterium]
MSPMSLSFGLLFSLSGVASAQDTRIPAYDDQAPPPAAEEVAPKPKAVPAIWTVSEGTEAVLVEDHRVPEVVLVVEIPVGTYSPWLNAQHGVEAWELQMYDADGALRARADALAADLSVYCEARTCTLELVALKRDLEASVALVQDVLKNTSYDKAELKRTDQGRKIGWEGSQTDPDWRLSQTTAQLLYTEGDPRLQSYVEPEKVLRDPKALAAARDAALRLPGRRVGFAGDLTRAEAEAIAATLLPPVNTVTPADLAPAYLPLRADRPASLIEPMDNLTQIYFALMRDGITLEDPNYPAFLVANHVLGGHFFSRLYVSLRHEGGETYGAYTRGGGGATASVYSLSTFTRVENKATTEAKLRAVLTTFHEGGVTEQERIEAIGYLQGSELFDQQSPSNLLSTTLTELTLGLPPGFFVEATKRASALSTEEINTFIKAHYDPAAFSMVTVEPEP